MLVVDIQMHELRPFDYATYLAEKLHEGFLSLQTEPNPTFKFYSLLMHMVLFYGHMKGLCPGELKVTSRNKEGQEQQI